MFKNDFSFNKPHSNEWITRQPFNNIIVEQEKCARNVINIKIVDLRFCTSSLNAAICFTIEQNQLSLPVDKEICTSNNQQNFYIYLSACVYYFTPISLFQIIHNLWNKSKAFNSKCMLYVKLHPPFYYKRITARNFFIVSVKCSFTAIAKISSFLFIT